jgi:hypothetical protein
MQVQTYEALLQDLYPTLDPSSAQRVDQTISGQSVRDPMDSSKEDLSVSHSAFFPRRPRHPS